MQIFSFTIVSFLNIAFCLEVAAAQASQTAAIVDPPAVTPEAGMVPDNAFFLGQDGDKPRTVFIADKSQRTLTVWNVKTTGPDLIGAYPMDIGKRGGDKTAEGDHKTPEGLFFIQSKLEGPGLNFDEYGVRAFPLDYPNFFDKKVGKTGSGIWLHAVPDTTSLFRGSRGCVVVRNETINKLTSMITLQTTPMIILDKVNYITKDEFSKKREEAFAWLKSWQSSWENKNIDQYISHYAEDFRAQNMSKKNWKQYKNSLNQKYQYIKVKITDALLIARKDEAIIHFVQDYESNGHKAIGEKSLYASRASDKQLQIVTELWRPLTPEIIAQKQTASTVTKANSEAN